MRPSPPMGTTGESEYSPEDAGDGAAAGTVRVSLRVQTPQASPQAQWPPMLNRPQQREPACRQSQSTGAGPSWPRANQARTPPLGPRSTRGSERAAESATCGPDGPRPLRRTAGGSRREAVARLIGGPGRTRQPPAREAEALRPAAA